MKKKINLKRKRFSIPIIILVVLVIFRLALPFLVKKNVNSALANIPGYFGEVEDIEISLFRGAYVIHNMYLNKKTAKTEVPFLKLNKVDISIEWKSLFKGEIVSEIILTRPQLIFVFEDHTNRKGEDSDLDDWTSALTKLVPIEINRMVINEGKLAFVQLNADPNIDLYMDQVFLTATNLRNVTDKSKKLPSNINAKAISIGGGKVNLEGRLNLLKKIPDVDISFALENADATSLNDFSNHYAGIDFNKGVFELYSEVIISDGYMEGYFKPILKNSKLLGKEDGFLNTLWEGLVGFFKFLLKNHKQNTLATKIPVQGNLNDVEANSWFTVINIFKNAWIKAYKGEIDETIEFEDIDKKD